MKRLLPRKAKYLLLLLLFSTSLTHAFAQSSSVNGSVTDEEGEGLPGVTVLVKGTTNGTVTDIEGNYSLNVADAKSTLVFSYIGFKSQEVPVGNNTLLNITLATDSKQLEEVVVVGYGTQKKSDLTGAISSVGAKDIEKAAPVNATQALQGRASGVLVTSNSGAPGGEGAIRIRGVGTINNNDPVYIVDGMFVSSINFLSPSDISSIEVLKDASATAIYGSRGANGVILVTTHKGKSGKPVIVFNANVGVSSPANITEMVNNDQYFDYVRTAYYNGYMRTVEGANAGIDPFTTTDPFFAYLQAVKTEYDKGHNTDWFKEVLRPNPTVQNYDVSIRGGGEAMRYAISAGYFDQQGLINNSSYKRYSFRLNTDYNINKRLVIGENLGVTLSRTLGFQDEGMAGVIGNLMFMDPLTPVYNPEADINDPDYEYNRYATSGFSDVNNPAAQIARNHNNIDQLKLVGNVYGQLDLVKGLKLRTSIGYDYNNSTLNDFLPRYYVGPRDNLNISTVINNQNQFLGLVWENTLNYTTTIAEHHTITGLLGYTEERYHESFVEASRQNTANNDPALQVFDAATGAISLQGNKRHFSLRSYFARVNYNFGERYLLTASIRRDGSSRFADGNKWGAFPSLSAGWRINEENFFKNLDLSAFSQLKIRAGWGQIGNQSMPGGNNNPYLSLIQGTSNYRYILGDQLLAGNYLTSLGTPSITWETSQQTNVGLDMGFFNNKFTGSVDFFVKNTKDMLLQVQVPAYTGFPDIPYTNAGDVQNKGFEVELRYVDAIGDFTYGVSGNVSRFVNQAVSLGPGDRPIVYSDFYSNVNRTEVGRPIGAFYGWVTDGLFQNHNEVEAHQKDDVLLQPQATPGDMRFKDLNGDGLINSDDRTWIGNPLPDFTYGLNLNLGYKNFDFTALFQGSYGNDIYNVGKGRLGSLGGKFNASQEAYTNAWRGEGTSNTQPRMSTSDLNDNFRTSDWYVEDGSYLRLKNLQFGYTPQGSLVEKAGISNSRIWIGGTDLFTITNYSGTDPEVGLTASPIQAGRDTFSYPKMRRISMGVNLTF